MMSRFTEKAQEALQRAQQIMFSKQHTQLDVEHIFLALLQQRNSLPAQIITKLGGDVPTMIRRLDSALGNMQSFTVSRGTATGYITLRCNRVLQGAAEEADRLNDEYISTEHILLGIAQVGGGSAGELLQEAEIDQEKIYRVLREIRGNSRYTPEALEEPPSPPVKLILNPSALPKPGGFSHGILTAGGSLLFLAGQIATDAEGQVALKGDVVGQYEQTLSNLKAVVEDAGGQMTDIVKMTIFVRDRDDYKAHLKELGRVHRSFFGSYYPATALLEISRFFEDDVLVEIEGIAVLPYPEE